MGEKLGARGNSPRGNNQKGDNPSRKKALLALEKSLKTGLFLDETLGQKEKGSDFAFAKCLAYGAMSRQVTLDAIAQKWAPRGIEKNSPREKALLRLAIFEAAFCEGIPRHATLFEWVELAKKTTYPAFAKFLNALLRKVGLYEPCGDLSLDYSIPPPLLKKLESEYPKETLLQILQAVNQEPHLFARKRPDYEMTPIEDVEKIAQDPSYYIQNSTPVMLVKELLGKLPIHPKKILDLCASPGGKLLLLHDVFPEAALFACEVNERRAKRLFENIKKYDLHVNVTLGKGEEYLIPKESPFDLVVVDVPCSNSGVLAKRPEARHHEKAPLEIQKKLLDHSLILGKWVIYMTCSILREENEEMTKRYSPVHQHKILPDFAGREGGYGALIRSPYF